MIIDFDQFRSIQFIKKLSQKRVRNSNNRSYKYAWIKTRLYGNWILYTAFFSEAIQDTLFYFSSQSFECSSTGFSSAISVGSTCVTTWRGFYIRGGSIKQNFWIEYRIARNRINKRSWFQIWKLKKNPEGKWSQLFF